MEVVVGVAVGVLVVVILFATIGIVILVHKKCRQRSKVKLEDGQTQNNTEQVERQSPDRMLITDELEDPPITLQEVLDDEVWIEDMTGVMSHCIPLLKGCHELTSQLVPITAAECKTPEKNSKVEEAALMVTPCINNVVQLLDGPIDPRLIEARCTVLFYAVNHLVNEIKNLLPEDTLLEWVDLSLKDIEGHLKILQEQSQRICSRSLSNSSKGREPASSPMSEVHGGGHTKNTSRASSSHTDSAESGIDVNINSDQLSYSDSEEGKSPSTPVSATARQLAVESPQQLAIAEVHNEPEQIELEDVAFTNSAYREDEEDE